ncbi:O-antigen ligase family protein [Nocardioides sp. HDW12B]|uniref:O-antigen ligase family protein n=1 Tax=Nocardioides sp. HDW12B TaxID=2714939 RepID=UPI00140C213C|nr:O-antigen ligase family protein [Nocardioides sp. HDW12B]QIK66861.1 O-antigen ligase family protein [Nocardioides sp. HDW12B]
MTASLLLAAVAWSLATRGGTDLRDLVVVLALLGSAGVAVRARLPRDPLLVGSLAALLTWLVALGPLRDGLSLETARIPLLVGAATLTVLVVARLDRAQRELFVTGLVVLGCLHAVVVLGEFALAVAQGVPYPSRPASTLGSATGLGMLLVATSVLTAREAERGGGRLSGLALGLQGAALLATGSRTAILVAGVLLLGYAATRPSRVLRALTGLAVLVGGAMVAWRVATEPLEQRPHLWQQALGRIAEHPLVGAGTLPEPYERSVPGARVTTHAHNELLQWGVEYGLVGLALGVLVVVLALRRCRSWTTQDCWLQVAAAAPLCAGLVDFTLRITAVAVVAAALAALATTEPPAALPDEPVTPALVGARPSSARAPRSPSARTSDVRRRWRPGRPARRGPPASPPR